MTRIDLVQLYATMRLIRRFEEVVGDHVLAGAIGGPTHLCIGQEAVAAGACAALRSTDLVFGGHRSHGHFLAKGGSARALAAEIFGRSTGCCRGRGGSMHLQAAEVGILGTSALVGGNMGPAVGIALAERLAQRDTCVLVFFGDGAVEEGVFHETFNFAALRRLSVVWVCENNLYSSHLPIGDRQPRGEIWRFAEPYGVPGVRIDGNDVLAVRETTAHAVQRARGGAGPTLIECMTYRWRGHVGAALDLDKGLRTQAELDAWMSRDPVARYADRLAGDGTMTGQERAAIDASVERTVADAIAFAATSPYPDPADVTAGVYWAPER